MRWTSRLLCGAALLTCLTTGVAQASGFPDFDGDRERVLHGRVVAGETPVETPADRSGPWKEDDGALTLGPRADDAPNNAVWLAKHDDFADGLVRARVRTGDRLDASILFRVRADGDLRALSGYELSIDDDTLRLQRWDRGKVLPVGAEVKVPKLDGFKSLEIVIYLVGPQILATVYDGDKLQRIASLAAHETTHRKGRVGFRAGKRAENMSFGLLSFMDSHAPAPPRKGSGKQGALKLYGPDADPGTTPFGNTRFAFVPAKAAAKLPRDLRRAIEGRLPGPDGTPEAVVFTDAVGLERMRRLGTPVRAVDSNVAWKTFDAPYREHSTRKPVATRRGFRLDLSYKSPAMVEDLLRAYQRKYAKISTLVQIGASHGGRPIWALKISDNPTREEAEPAVLLNGAHHASELLSIEFPLDAAATLLEGYGRDREVTRWIDEMEIFVVPLVNPDGTWMFLEQTRFAGRKNGRDNNADGIVDPFEGVDLNRNYGFGWGERGSGDLPVSKYYRGPHAGSEPETWAMMSMAERERFVASISFHTVGSAIFVPYTVDGAAESKPDAPLAIGKEIAEAGLVQPNDKTIRVRANGYPVAGSDQDWLRHRYGTAAFILEGSHHNPPLEIRAQAVEATRPIWRALLERVARGPRISGHVRDASGKPIEAEVRVEQVTLQAGERWTSRPSDGRFDRLIARAGKYTLRVEADGYAPKQVDVAVRKPVEIDITLDPS